MAKDAQKSKVYKAEQDFLRPSHSTYVGDIFDCQSFVTKVLRRAYVQKHYGAYDGIIVKGVPKKYRWAHAYPIRRIIEVGIGNASKWARTDAVLLHEIAHVLAYDRYGVCSHGWQFAATFLDLVRNVMGKEAADALKKGYRHCGVKFREPRKRKPMDPAKKAAQAERLAKAREKREAQLAPKRAMKERALKLHHKTRNGYNPFTGAPAYSYWIGNPKDSGIFDRRAILLDKAPQYMSYAEIEEALKDYDALFKQDPVTQPMTDTQRMIMENHYAFGLQKPQTFVTLTGNY